MRLVRLSAVVGTGVVLAMVSGCGGDALSVGYDRSSDTSEYKTVRSQEAFGGEWPEDYQQSAVLADGRKVFLWYSRGGSKLMEQHYSPLAKAWTSPHVVHVSGEADPCQGIEIVERDGVVAVIADFGTYCYDGEPPSDSLAVVSAGDLTDWKVDATPGFDGWAEVAVNDADTVTWRGSGESLTWSPSEGFSGGV